MRSRVSSSDSLVFSQKLVQDRAGVFFVLFCFFEGGGSNYSSFGHYELLQIGAFFFFEV